jgi:hypothetical protein
VVQRCLELLDQRGVLMFPRIGLNDAEQLAFTDKLGARVNFTGRVPGGNSSAQDVYTITLDPKINTEPEYVLGTYFWHMDGLTSPAPCIASFPTPPTRDAECIGRPSPESRR